MVNSFCSLHWVILESCHNISDVTHLTTYLISLSQWHSRTWRCSTRNGLKSESVHCRPVGKLSLRAQPGHSWTTTPGAMTKLPALKLTTGQTLPSFTCTSMLYSMEIHNVCLRVWALVWMVSVDPHVYATFNCDMRGQGLCFNNPAFLSHSPEPVSQMSCMCIEDVIHCPLHHPTNKRWQPLNKSRVYVAAFIDFANTRVINICVELWHPWEVHLCLIPDMIELCLPSIHDIPLLLS